MSFLKYFIFVTFAHAVIKYNLYYKINFCNKLKLLQSDFIEKFIINLKLAGAPIGAPTSISPKKSSTPAHPPTLSARTQKKFFLQPPFSRLPGVGLLPVPFFAGTCQQLGNLSTGHLAGPATAGTALKPTLKPRANAIAVIVFLIAFFPSSF